MRFISLDTLAEAQAVDSPDQELAELDAFIEAQLKTGVLLPLMTYDNISATGNQPARATDDRVVCR